MNLFNTADGTWVRVVKIHLTSVDIERLFSYGIYVGCHLQKLKAAPFRDPILIYVNGVELFIRRQEAVLIFVEELE